MNPSEKQKIALEYLTDYQTEFIGYGGAAGGGKSYLGCYWLMQLGFYAPGTRYFIGRDSLKNTRDSVLNTWRKLSKELQFTEWKYQDNYIRFKNGSEIEFLDLSFYPQKDPLYERFGSREYTGGWIEEAAPVNYMAFEVLKTRIGRWMNDEYNIKKKILCTFNPRKTWIDRVFYRPYANKKETERIKFIPALATDNPHLPADYIKTLEELKDEATKQRLLYGNFDYDDDPSSLISYYDIQALYTNLHVKDGDKYITADVARYGSDKAIILVWSGLKIIEKYVFPVSSTVDIENCINSLRVKHAIIGRNIIIDSDGVGGGVVDHIAGCTGFVNNGKPKDKQYYNLKSECGYKLAEIINDIHIESELSEQEKEEINQELGQLKTFDSDKDNKLRIMPKEKIKENIGRSPDWLDNFTMRMYPLIYQYRSRMWH